ncbi:MAG: transcriptional repressor [Phycisphaeraceae bacterium]|nr:transcriptional repressor [Phycisphaeraceae bacterium]
MAETELPRIEIVEPLCAVFRRRLKSEGAKYTPERAQVLDAIIRTEGLFEVEALIDELRHSRQRVSKATVYRTIRLLLDAGIIQRVPFEGETDRYQLVYGRRPHDLIIRTDTGEAIPVTVPELEAIRDRLCAERGLRAQSHRLHIFASG